VLRDQQIQEARAAGLVAITPPVVVVVVLALLFFAILQHIQFLILAAVLHIQQRLQVVIQSLHLPPEQAMFRGADKWRITHFWTTIIL
jgi:hypothetical protein